MKRQKRESQAEGPAGQRLRSKNVPEWLEGLRETREKTVPHGQARALLPSGQSSQPFLTQARSRDPVYSIDHVRAAENTTGKELGGGGPTEPCGDAQAAQAGCEPLPSLLSTHLATVFSSSSLLPVRDTC